jgi:endonuclease/exonuclease/phosphatase family metal-dependent hydrolase
MKNKVIYLLIVLTVAFVCNVIDVSAQRKTKDLTINVMSFNIRMNYQDDGPNNWQYRRDYMADLIHYYQPGLLGTQESFYPQYVDLKERLTDYNSFGPVEGRQGAESVAIFYQKERFKLIDSGTFWLSQTPEKQSIGWDAALRRVVTWGEFSIKANNRKIFFFVTHFDHKGTVAREESAKLLLKKVHEIAGKVTAFIVGDFNLREESIYYKILTSGTDTLSPFYDTYKLANKPYGPTWTIQDFGKIPVDKRPKIDYIFSNKKVSVIGYINIADQRGDVYPSDHNAQMATIKL